MIIALLLAKLMSAPTGQPMCAPTNDPRVTECAVKFNHDVRFMQCVQTGPNSQTCFEK